MIFHNGDFKEYNKWKHSIVPPPADLGKGVVITKTLYVFSDPVDVIKSLFRRRIDNKQWLKGHAKNMDILDFSASCDVIEYANTRKDLLRLNDHWKNWNDTHLEYDTMYVKYEDMWENLTEIQGFLGLPESFVSSFPAKRDRNAFLIEPAILNELKETYHSLSHKVATQPSTRVKKHHRKYKNEGG